MEHRELTNTLCFPLTASWTVRIRVLGRLGTLLFKRISNKKRALCKRCSESGGFLQAHENRLCSGICSSLVKKIHRFI